MRDTACEQDCQNKRYDQASPESARIVCQRPQDEQFNQNLLLKKFQNCTALVKTMDKPVLPTFCSKIGPSAVYNAVASRDVAMDAKNIPNYSIDG